MNYSQRRRSRRSRRGGSTLNPASYAGGRRNRSRRSRRGGGVNFPLTPASIGGLTSSADGGDRSIPFNGIAGAGLSVQGTQGGVLTQALTGGGYRRRRSRRSRRDRR